jgi:hypothetical protein
MSGSCRCEDCHAELIDNEDVEEVRGSQDRMQRFNWAMRFVLQGLKKTESMVIPAYVTPYFQACPLSFFSNNLGSQV